MQISQPLSDKKFLKILALVVIIAIIIGVGIGLLINYWPQIKNLKKTTSLPVQNQTPAPAPTPTPTPAPTPNQIINPANGGYVLSTDKLVSLTVQPGATTNPAIFSISAAALPSLPQDREKEKLLTLGGYHITATDSINGANILNLSSPMTVTFQYSENQIIGTTPESLTIYYYDSEIKAWTKLEKIQINTQSQTISGDLTKLGIIGIFALKTAETTEGWIEYTQKISKNKEDYRFEFVSQSNYPTLKKGEMAILTLKLKNTGVATWYQSGPNAFRLGAAAPQDRESIFATSTWLGKSRAASLQESEVRTGEIGTFVFVIQAKSDTEAGSYKEHFLPLVENLFWLDSYDFYWDVTIVDEKSQSGPIEGEEQVQ